MKIFAFSIAETFEPKDLDQVNIEYNNIEQIATWTSSSSSVHADLTYSYQCTAASYSYKKCFFPTGPGCAEDWVAGGPWNQTCDLVPHEDPW